MSPVTNLAKRPNGAFCITTVLLLLLTIHRQRTQLFGVILMTERWSNEHKRLLLAAALLHNKIVNGDDYNERHMHVEVLGSDPDTRSWYHGTAASIECLQAPLRTPSSPDPIGSSRFRPRLHSAISNGSLFAGYIIRGKRR